MSCEPLIVKGTLTMQKRQTRDDEVRVLPEATMKSLHGGRKAPHPTCPIQSKTWMELWGSPLSKLAATIDEDPEPENENTLSG